jgi:hypothetical protein
LRIQSAVNQDKNALQIFAVPEIEADEF